MSYNHIRNLGQGVLNDFGGVYLATYNATGNVISNNKIHDITDASSQDSDGYGGNAIYIDRGGPITVSSNLTYRTINSLNFTIGPPSIGQTIAASNNILAFPRKNFISVYACPKAGYSQFAMSNGIFLQDHTSKSVPSSAIQTGMTYLSSPVGTAQKFTSNDYWNTSEVFATDTKAFNAESTAACGGKAFYALAGWQALGEDVGTLSQDPGFTNPTYPADDFSFLVGPPSIGFVPFNTAGTCATCPGRTSPVIVPAAVPPGFLTVLFNPATDF